MEVQMYKGVKCSSDFIFHSPSIYFGSDRIIMVSHFHGGVVVAQDYHTRPYISGPLLAWGWYNLGGVVGNILANGLFISGDTHQICSTDRRFDMYKSAVTPEDFLIDRVPMDYMPKQSEGHGTIDFHLIHHLMKDVEFVTDEPNHIISFDKCSVKGKRFVLPHTRYNTARRLASDGCIYDRKEFHLFHDAKYDQWWLRIGFAGEESTYLNDRVFILLNELK